MGIAKGSPVKQIMPAPVKGFVTDYGVDRETGELQVKVEWADADGDHARYFKADEVEVMPDAADDKAAAGVQG